MLYNVDYILNDIEDCIIHKKPFSIARLGDGDLKLLLASLGGKIIPWKYNQQGIPENKINWIQNLYKESCNNANYVSSFDMYFDGTLWNRPISKGIRKKIRGWKDIYSKLGIVNENYCSPEVGFLFFLDDPRNLFTVLQGKKVCLITCFSNVERQIKSAGYNVETILIPGRNKNHYNHYDQIIKELQSCVNQFDAFLVGGGSLGRGYSSCIKTCGGVAIDIGQVFDCWHGSIMPKRIKHVMFKTDHLTFKLTKRANEFRKYF